MSQYFSDSLRFCGITIRTIRITIQTTEQPWKVLNVKCNNNFIFESTVLLVLSKSHLSSLLTTITTTVEFAALMLMPQGTLETYMRTIFLTLKSSSGATSGFSPLSVCRTSCWTIRSNNTQYWSVELFCLSADRQRLVNSRKSWYCHDSFNGKSKKVNK